MNNILQNIKWVNVTPPGAIVDDASYTTASVDTAGFSGAVFLISLGATDIAMAALKLQESDDNSTFADVTGAIFGTSADPTGTTSSLPSATNDNKIFAIFVKCGGNRKRYLDLVATAGNGSTGTYLNVLCGLVGASSMEINASGLGLNQYLVV